MNQKYDADILCALKVTGFAVAWRKHLSQMIRHLLTNVSVIVFIGLSGCSKPLEQNSATAETMYQFRTQKLVDENAGAWKSDDGRCLLFFFTDHTVLQIYFGETTIGIWRYLDPKNKALEFTEAPDSTFFRPANLDGDSLFINHGDYADRMTRLKLHRKP